jgi:hypothetical protein
MRRHQVGATLKRVLRYVRGLENDKRDLLAALAAMTDDRDAWRARAEADERLPICPCGRMRLEIWCACGRRLL